MRSFSELLIDVQRVNKAMGKPRLTKAEKARRRLEQKLWAECERFNAEKHELDLPLFMKKGNP